MSNPGFEKTLLLSPPSDLIEHANITAYMQSKGFDNYEAFYQWSLEHRTEFWDDQAGELHWFHLWDETFQWTSEQTEQAQGLESVQGVEHAQGTGSAQGTGQGPTLSTPRQGWFTGGKFNIVYNCLDRHMQTTTRTKVAYYWEGDDGATSTITYEQLYKMTNQLAKGLQNLGVQKGDRVAIYMPMIPELPAAMLAVARLGAVHAVVFGGLAAPSLRDRILDAEARVLITADGSYRGGRYINLKKLADEAVAEAPIVEKTVVMRHLGNDVPMQAGRDIYWDELVADIPEDIFVPCEPMDSEDPLYILYTVGEGSRRGRGLMQFSVSSGGSSNDIDSRRLPTEEVYTPGSARGTTPTESSGDVMGLAQETRLVQATGQEPTLSAPTGVVHVHTGYAVGTYATTRFVFDVKESDVYWCAAEIGWIIGHSYIVYGPLMNGLTSVLFEGTPVYPAPDRFWRIVEKFKVTIFYTSPTAIRGLMRFGETWPTRHGISSLRLLGTVGEPINPQAWLWYRHNIGYDKLPIMDTWCQTETGMILLTPTIRLPLKPGSVSRPFPTIEADVIDENGQSVGLEQSGFLVLRHPWPAQTRSVCNVGQMWGNKPGIYITGDKATLDKDGYFRIQGHVDDVVEVGGYRLCLMEIESSLVSHPAIAEAVAIGKPDLLKGEHVKVFVILKQGFAPSEKLEKDLQTHIRTTMGDWAVPDELEFAPGLPKTYSSKIIQRIIRSLELNESISDITIPGAS